MIKVLFAAALALINTGMMMAGTDTAPTGTTRTDTARTEAGYPMPMATVTGGFNINLACK